MLLSAKNYADALEFIGDPEGCEAITSALQDRFFGKAETPRDAGELQAEFEQGFSDRGDHADAGCECEVGIGLAVGAHKGACLHGQVVVFFPIVSCAGEEGQDGEAGLDGTVQGVDRARKVEPPQVQGAGKSCVCFSGMLSGEESFPLYKDPLPAEAQWPGCRVGRERVFDSRGKPITFHLGPGSGRQEDEEGQINCVGCFAIIFQDSSFIYRGQFCSRRYLK